MRLSALTAVLLCAALLAAGCGGGSSGGSNTTAAPEGDGAAGGAAGGGAPKKATAPNAPAGSKVVACDSSGGAAEQLHATAVDCGTARGVMRQWGQSRACALAEGASRNSCSLDGFRCQAVRTDQGGAVSCARPGGDVSFVSRSGGG
jgi:hypothetical protein